MAFGVGWLEFAVIGIVAVLVFGPERLPRMIAQAAQWVRVVRAQATSARDDLMAAADLDPSIAGDLRQSMSDLADLHPRRLASSLVNDVTEPFRDAAGAATAAASEPTDGEPDGKPGRDVRRDLDDVT